MVPSVEGEPASVRGCASEQPLVDECHRVERFLAGRSLHEKEQRSTGVGNLSKMAALSPKHGDLLTKEL